MDSSALVKLLIREPESDVLAERLAGASLTASELAIAEVGRVLRRSTPPERSAETLWRIVALVAIDRPILRRAIEVGTPPPGSLDAIHLATALSIADDVDVFITYDRRLGAAAAATGFTVEAPGEPA